MANDDETRDAMRALAIKLDQNDLAKWEELSRHGIRDGWSRTMMYEAFDSFINVDTWYTLHSTDEQRFYEALKKVVWSDEFNPDQMAKYFRTKLKISDEDYRSHFAKAIDRYRDDAWAVKDFLKFNNVSERP